MSAKLGLQLLLVLCPIWLGSQVVDTSFQLLQYIPVQSVYTTVDNLQNIYLATKQGKVLKYNTKGVNYLNIIIIG